MESAESLSSFNQCCTCARSDHVIDAGRGAYLGPAILSMNSIAMHHRAVACGTGQQAAAVLASDSYQQESYGPSNEACSVTSA